MANQAIALGVRAPQTDILGGAIQRNAQLMNMMAQQRASERQAAQAAQEMQLKQQLAVPQMAKAQSEAQSAQLKYVTDFLNTSALALSNVRNADEAHNVAQILHQHFPDMDQAIAQTMSSIPQNPADFDAWRQRTLYQTMDAKEQLKQKFIDITTGDQTYTMATPEYAGSGMPTAEVPGTRVNAPQGITYVRGPNGEVIPMPTKTTGGTAPGLVGGPRGSVAAALQTNPGALKDGAFAKSQPGYTGASGGFATFATPEAGIAAQEALLRGSYVNKGYNTIDKIVNRYAPPGPENSAASVSNYKKYIAGQTGIDINQPITAAQVPAVAKAMREFETGQRPGGGGAGGVQMGQPLPGTSKAEASAPARQRVSDILAKIGAAYEALNKTSNIPSEKRGGFANFFDYLATSSGGREVQRMVGTEASKHLTQITNLRKQLATAIKNAAGMSAQEMNSNVELNLMLDALSDPTQGIEAARQTLTDLEDLYGAKSTTKAPKRLKFNPATGDFE